MSNDEVTTFYSYLDTMSVLLYMWSTQTISVVLMVKVIKLDRHIFCLCTRVFKTILITRLHQLLFFQYGDCSIWFMIICYRSICQKMIIFISFPTDSLEIDMNDIFRDFQTQQNFSFANCLSSCKLVSRTILNLKICSF